jgi:voltage-gated potassium channel
METPAAGDRPARRDHLADVRRRCAELRRGDEDSFEHWLASATERADPTMAWLGLLFALLVGYELAVDLSPAAARTLEIAGWTIWAVFVAEFAAKLWLAPRRARFVRRHWVQALALIVPTLRALRFLRLVRLGRALPSARVLSSSYRTVGSARALLSSRLGYLGAIGVVVTVAAAELAFLFERDTARPAFDSFGDAVLWASSVVLALQGDPVPTSTGGRLVMLAGFAFGLVLIASLAGTLGAFLIEGGHERRSRQEREP